MILAALSDTGLREATAHAALPEEDYLSDERAVLEALRFGFPRLLVTSDSAGDAALMQSARKLRPKLAVLTLRESTLREWERDWRERAGRASREAEFGSRMAGLVHVTAQTPRWVDDVFRQLSNATGGPLPPAFRGFSRRVLEFPRRYPDLHAVARLTGYSRDALKARFRRKGLPSPSRYLRWLRTLAVAYALEEAGATTASVAYRFGYSSGGNLCRSVQGLVGLPTLPLRQPIVRSQLMLRMAAELLEPSQRRAWAVMEDLFVRWAA